MVQKALSAIIRMGEKEGASMIIDVLRGSRKQEIVAQGYDKLKTHGAGSEIPAMDWQRYLMQMLNLGILEMAYDENFALRITESGKEILFGKKPIELTVLQIIKPAEKTNSVRKESSLSPDQELFNLLKKVRKDFAMAENVPAYVIFSDASLDEMAKEKPMTDRDLLMISGVGEHKLNKYGASFLTAIIDFSPSSSAQKAKGSTYIETLNLYRQHNSVEEISRLRNLALPTIFSHIAQLYLNGDIESLATFVNQDEIIQVKEAIKTTGENKIMKPLFEHLKEQIPYHKIRLAMAVLEKLKN